VEANVFAFNLALLFLSGVIVGIRQNNRPVLGAA
jgi:hypothetical protein